MAKHKFFNILAVIKLRTILVGALCVVLVASSFFIAQKIKLVYVSTLNGKIIVIDAGHGGVDGGVVGVNGTVESEINLKISKILRHYLQEKGYKVVLTRTGENGLYEVGAKNKKLSDMQKRKEIINENSPDLVISIHQNSYPLKTVKGAQVFYAESNEKSSEIAQCLQNALNEFYSQDKKSKKADYYVLQCSPYPTVLIECGFLSNAQDEKNLNDSTFRESLAKAIANSVDKIFSNLA